MNSFHVVLLAAFVGMISYVDTTIVPIKYGELSGNCQKNLLKRQCNRCEDACSSVEENLLEKWTSGITDLLINEEGVDMFEVYLNACGFRESKEQLIIWRNANFILPYTDYIGSEVDNAESLSRAKQRQKYQLFLFHNGMRLPSPRNKFYYVRVLQNSIRESLTENYGKFQRKLLSDYNELKNYNAYLCRQDSLAKLINKTN